MYTISKCHLLLIISSITCGHCLLANILNSNNNNNNNNNGNDNNTASNQAVEVTNVVLVNKCCFKFEAMVDAVCMHVNESKLYKPEFINEQAFSHVKETNTNTIKYKFVIGLPACGSMQMWPIFDYRGSTDKLVLLSNGKLRHYTNSEDLINHDNHLVKDEDLEDNSKRHFYDYEPNQYCIERAILTRGNDSLGPSLFANLCLNRKELKWTETSFLMKKVLNPICHIISLIILIIIAIVYFILPTLRDLVGNMVTTIAVCLIFTQVADLVRIFTEFSNHVSFIVADLVLQVSILSTFFWLTSFGYYIWKTFRSRNVFLRVTDGRKYCYYSSFVWGTTAVLTVTAIFAHFILDADSYKKQHMIADQETIGWLGISIFFAPIACTILINIFFYVTTVKLINRRNVYGRIQHKLKSNFIMFALMLLVISIGWLFFCLSWLQFDGLFYSHIIYNALQAPLLLYICVIRQRHVKFLLKKSCCYNEPPSINDWGDELHNMNSYG